MIKARESAPAQRKPKAGTKRPAGTKKPPRRRIPAEMLPQKSVATYKARTVAVAERACPECKRPFPMTAAERQRKRRALLKAAQ